MEHAQLVLILFHSLNFMQKKSVLLVTGSGAVRCSEAVKTPMKDSQLLHLSRLLLLLEYMMKHLYDAPPALLEQVSGKRYIRRLIDYRYCEKHLMFLVYRLSSRVSLRSSFLSCGFCIFICVVAFLTGLQRCALFVLPR